MFSDAEWPRGSTLDIRVQIVTANPFQIQYEPEL